jgi:hypothetical protein
MHSDSEDPSIVKLVGLFLIQFYPNKVESIVKCFTKLSSLDPCSIVASNTLCHYSTTYGSPSLYNTFNIIVEQLVYQPSNLVLWKLFIKLLKTIKKPDEEKVTVQLPTYFRYICLQIPPVIQQCTLDHIEKQDLKLYVTLLFNIATTIYYIDGKNALNSHPVLPLLKEIYSDPITEDINFLPKLLEKFEEVEIKT